MDLSAGAVRRSVAKRLLYFAVKRSSLSGITSVQLHCVAKVVGMHQLPPGRRSTPGLDPSELPVSSVNQLRLQRAQRKELMPTP